MSSHLTTVDRSYLLHEQLGEGGMGTVYRATQLTNRQTVALKLVPLHEATSSAGATEPDVYLRMALAREFQTLASLHHPNVIRVQNYGFDDQHGPYYTMELLRDARNIVEAGQGQPESVQVRLIANLLRALSYIHRRGVLHRDVKPGNVLVVEGEAKLLDFGLAIGVTQEADFTGSLDHMAPELLAGSPPSVASDLYAVGIVFHQMLSGALPVAQVSSQLVPDPEQLSEGVGLDGLEPPAGPQPSTTQERLSLMEMLDRLELHDEPQNELATELQGPLGDIVRKLLKYRPEERYQDAEHVLLDLAAAVSSELPIETAETRESFIRANDLVGREAERELLRQALERARDRAGSTFLVGGESGVGKSRLIAELRTLALVLGFWVAEGQSVAEGGYYYQEWHLLARELCFRTNLTDQEASILKDLVPDVAELLGRPVPDPPTVPADQAQRRIAETLCELLHRQKRPVAIVLEDLHWARTESLALLAHLCTRAPELPLLLLGSYRSDESPELPDLVPGAQLMPLRRLERSDIARLSISMLGAVGGRQDIVSYLEQQTEGNVFFLVETVRALAENAGELRRIGDGEMPETVLTLGIERIVERRVDRIPNAYLPMLEFAATLGRRLDLQVLASSFPEMPLRTFLVHGANAAVFESQGNEWRFAHDKLRETIRRRLPQAKRQRLHREVAEALETLYEQAAREPMAAMLAYHCSEAGLHDRALIYYIIAGDSAARLCLYDQARAHYAAGQGELRHLPDTAPYRRAKVDLLLKQVQTALLTDPAQTQMDRLAEARALLEAQDAETGDASANDPLRMARVNYYSGRVLHYSGQPAAAIKYFQRVLPVAQELGDEELLVMPASVIGVALCMQGHNSRGRDLLKQAIGPLQRLGNKFEYLRAVLFHGLTSASCGNFTAGLADMEQAYAEAVQINQPSVLAMCQLMFSAIFRVAGDWPQCIRAAKRSIEHAKQSGDKVYLFSSWSYLGWAQSYLGEHEAALASRSEALAIKQAFGGRLIITDWFDAADGEVALNAQRDWDALQKAQTVATTSRSMGLVLSTGLAERVWGAALRRLSDDPTESDQHFTASIAALQEGGSALDIAHTELWWARTCLERGENKAGQHHLALATQQFKAASCDYILASLQQLVTRPRETPA